MLDDHMIDITEEKVLIIDDDEDLVNLCVQVLQRLNLNIKFAYNHDMAFNILTTFIPDIILLDINMPEISGYQICEKLKAKYNYKDIPIIFISGSKGWQHIKKCYEVGVNFKATGDCLILAPSFVCEKKHIDEIFEKLRTGIKNYMKK